SEWSAAPPRKSDQATSSRPSERTTTSPSVLRGLSGDGGATSLTIASPAPSCAAPAGSGGRSPAQAASNAANSNSSSRRRIGLHEGLDDLRLDVLQALLHALHFLDLALELLHQEAALQPVLDRDAQIVIVPGLFDVLIQ